MASRIIHLAVAAELLRQIPFQNADRLKVGSVLPDAYGPGFSRKTSHFEKRLSDGRKILDLTSYRNLFQEKMASDDLYLGYYLHLVQDIVYRRFIYREHRWDPFPPGNVERLHNDYALLNTAVISRYSLKNDLSVPVGFREEEINRVSPFQLEQFLKDLDSDFLPYDTGGIFFFTLQMAENYIERAVRVCAEEIEALREGRPMMNELDHAWISRKAGEESGNGGENSHESI